MLIQKLQNEGLPQTAQKIQDSGAGAFLNYTFNSTHRVQCVAFASLLQTSGLTSFDTSPYNMFSSIGGNINGVKQMVEPQLLNSNQDTIVIGSYGAHRVTSQQDLIATLPGHFFVVYNVGNNPGHIGYVDSQLTEDGKFIVYDANYNFQGLNQNGVRKVIADGRIRTTILTPDEFIKKYGNVGEDKHTSQIAIILTQQEAIDLINQSQQSSPPTTTSQPIQIPTIVQQLNNQSSLSNELNLPSTYVPRDLVPVDQTLFAKNGIFNTQLWKGRNTYKISKQALPYLIAFLKDAQSQGYYLLITDTYRSYELQQEIHKQNPETSAPAGHSQHQTGLAFDIYIIDKDGNITSPNQQLIQIASQHGIIHPLPSDPPHFFIANGLYAEAYQDISSSSHDPNTLINAILNTIYHQSTKTNDQNSSSFFFPFTNLLGAIATNPRKWILDLSNRLHQIQQTLADKIHQTSFGKFWQEWQRIKRTIMNHNATVDKYKELARSGVVWSNNLPLPQPLLPHDTTPPHQIYFSKQNIPPQYRHYKYLLIEFIKFLWQKLSPHLPPISSPPYSPLKRNPQ